MKQENSKIKSKQINNNSSNKQNISLDNYKNDYHAINKNAILVFADGEYFHGYGIGNMGKVTGEICFNTAITGYQEILTDPSYAQQIINFTFPHIGNVGVNEDDIESKQVRAKGLIIRQPITNQSNYRATASFKEFLIKNNLTGICGIDTRAITQKIRKFGAKTVAIIYQNEINNEDIAKAIKEINLFPDLKDVELASIASENKHYHWSKQGLWNVNKNSYNLITKSNSKKYKVVAVDFGSKLNILRCLTQIGLDVEVVGAKASFEDILALKPDGIFLSNGPGDPKQTAKYANEVIKKILENKIPLFGICLGHQLMAIAVNAKTIKMHQGHRGANHPVQNIKTKKVEITSQNHGFCVDKKSLPDNVEITHISLFDNTIEGLRIKDSPAFCVQYHPESSPGPSDSLYLFNDFLEMIKESKLPI